MEQPVNHYAMLPPPTITRNPRRPLSAEDWEEQRAAIQRLYSTEDRDLHEVIEIMEKDRGFRATQKQYKTQIKNWRLEKNIKSKEMKAIIRIKRKRKEMQGKETDFTVRNRPVPPRKIMRYMGRTNTAENESFSHLSPAASTPSDILYSTPQGEGPPTPGQMPNIQPIAQSPQSLLASPAFDSSHGASKQTAIVRSSLISTPSWDAPSSETAIPVPLALLAHGVFTTPRPLPFSTPYTISQLPNWTSSISHDDLNQTSLLGDTSQWQITISTEPPSSPLAMSSSDDTVDGFLENSGTSISQEEKIFSAIALENSRRVVRKSAHLAVLNYSSEDEGAVQLLRKNQFDVSAKGFNEVKALHWAAERGHEPVVRLLLKIGTAFDAPDELGRTALHFAAIRGDERLLGLLLDVGANIEHQDRQGGTPLHAATFPSNEGATRILLDRGANVHSLDRHGWTALHRVTIFGSEKIARLLVEKGADANGSYKDGKLLLHEAARRGHEALVQLFLENGSHVNARSNSGNTALHDAAIHDQRGVIELLLGNGANIDAENEEGCTPLYYAALLGHRLSVKILIDNGANVRIKNKDGRSALNAMVHLDNETLRAKVHLDESVTRVLQLLKFRTRDELQQDHEAVVRLLMEKDSSELDSKDIHGYTLLMSAARRGCEPVAKLAIGKGANIDARDKSGKTALHWAALNGHYKTVKLLLENGAEIEARDKEYNSTALHLAATRGYIEVVQLLLENGAVLHLMTESLATHYMLLQQQAVRSL